MNKKQRIETDICLSTHFLIDRIRTNLIELEDFPYKKYEKYLRRLKNELKDYYWKI